MYVCTVYTVSMTSGHAQYIHPSLLYNLPSFQSPNALCSVHYRSTVAINTDGHSTVWRRHITTGVWGIPPSQTDSLLPQNLTHHI